MEEIQTRCGREGISTEESIDRVYLPSFSIVKK